MKKLSNVKMKNFSLWFSIISLLFVVNYIFKFSLHLNIRTLYLDDLAIFSIFKEKNFLEAIFLNTANKLRPVTHMIMYAAFWISDTDLQRLDFIILIWNMFIAIGVTAVAYQLVGENTTNMLKAILALAVGVLYSISRFSYYVWTEAFGLMESTALLLALGILLLLVQYVLNKNEKYLFLANFMFLIVIFTHERYIVLAVAIFMSIFLKHGMNRLSTYITPTLISLLFIGVRIFMFGNRFVDGTGGTSVLDTFSLKDTLLHIICQILYLFGVNAGPAYLNGIAYEEVSLHICILSIFQIIFLAGCFLGYVVLIIKLHDMEEVKRSILYITFIFCCIVSSSITIRVEMRWIYVSYAAFLIFMAQNIAYLIQHFEMKKFVIPGCIYLVFGFVCEEYYQSYYPNIYYWYERTLTSSLYEETLVKYGEDFLNRNVYIMGNSMMWTTAEWNQFYNQFFKEEIILSNVIYIERGGGKRIICKVV